MKRLIKRAVVAVVVALLACVAWVIYDGAADPPAERLLRRCEAKVPPDAPNREEFISACVRATFPWARTR
jgi:hypothetical protein